MRRRTEPEPTITDDRIALLDLIEKCGDAHLGFDLLSYAAERLMESPGGGADRASKKTRSKEPELGVVLLDAGDDRSEMLQLVDGLFDDLRYRKRNWLK